MKDVGNLGNTFNFNGTIPTMDDNSIQILREHLDFVKWMIGGGAATMASGIVVLYKTILIPMRDSYNQKNVNDALILKSIADSLHEQTGRPVLTCRYSPSPDKTPSGSGQSHLAFQQ